jgi:hypothetical protein
LPQRLKPILKQARYRSAEALRRPKAKARLDVWIYIQSKGCHSELLAFGARGCPELAEGNLQFPAFKERADSSLRSE